MANVTYHYPLSNHYFFPIFASKIIKPGYVYED